MERKAHTTKLFRSLRAERTLNGISQKEPGSTLAISHSLLSIASPTASSESMLSPDSLSPNTVSSATFSKISGRSAIHRTPSADTWNMLLSSPHAQSNGHSTEYARLLPWLQRTSSLNTLLEGPEAVVKPQQPSTPPLRSKSLDAATNSKLRFQSLTQLKFRTASPIDSSDDDSDTIIQDLTSVGDASLRVELPRGDEPVVNRSNNHKEERGTCANEGRVDHVNEENISSRLSSISLVCPPRDAVAPLSNSDPTPAVSNPPDVVPVTLTGSDCSQSYHEETEVPHTCVPLSTELPSSTPTHTLLPTDTSSSAGEDSERLSPAHPKVETVECITSSQPQSPESSDSVQFVVTFSASSSSEEAPEETKEDPAIKTMFEVGVPSSSELDTSGSATAVAAPDVAPVQGEITEHTSVVDTSTPDSTASTSKDILPETEAQEDKTPATQTPNQKDDPPLVTRSAERSKPPVKSKPGRRHSLPAVSKMAVEGRRNRTVTPKDRVTPVHRRYAGKSVRELSKMYESSTSKGTSKDAVKQITSPPRTRDGRGRIGKGTSPGRTSTRKTSSTIPPAVRYSSRPQTHSKPVKRKETTQEPLPGAEAPARSCSSQHRAAPTRTSRGKNVPSSPKQPSRLNRERPSRGAYMDCSRTVAVRPNSNANNNTSLSPRVHRHQRSVTTGETTVPSLHSGQDTHLRCGEGCKAQVERSNTFELSWTRNGRSSGCFKSLAGTRTQTSPGYVAKVTFTVLPEY